MRLPRFLLCSSLLVLSSSLTSGQSWLWGQEGYGGFNTGATGSSIATDKNGNVYFAGQYNNAIVFGPVTLSGYGINAYLVKYNSAGKVIWAKQSNDSVNADALSVATDTAGNIFITGNFIGNIAFGNITLHSTANGHAAFLVKYDTNGNVRWAKQSNSLYNNFYTNIIAHSVATDKSGNVFITGQFEDTISFGSYSLTSPYTYSAFLVKYDTSGNILWATQSTAASTNTLLDFSAGLAVASDSAGNSFVTGYFEDTVYVGTHKLISTYVPGNSYSIFLVKYSPAGNVLWAKQTKDDSANSEGIGNAVAIDRDGNSYITGYFANTVLFDSYSISSPGSDALFLAKYDTTGNALWVKQSTPGWEGYSLASDKANHIYLSGESGYFKVYPLELGGLKLGVNPSAKSASFIMEFNSDGNAECGSVLDNIGYFTAFDQPNDIAAGIASDTSGTYIYMVGGFHNDTVECGPDILLPKGGYDTFAGRWMPCASPIVVPPSENEPCNTIFVPDVFSPNGDGHNDVLYVRSTCISSLKFLVFDRWGNKVFETHNINQGWDGTYNGSPMNMGTYIWYLSATALNGSSIKKKGAVMLMR